MEASYPDWRELPLRNHGIVEQAHHAQNNLIENSFDPNSPLR